MSEPFLGEIRLFPIGYASQGWAYCEGQLLAINQNQALFSLLGTVYGGNGVTTFALPDLRGRVPIHAAPQYSLGAQGGEETHTLTVNEMPAHTHPVFASTSNADQVEPAGHVWAQYSTPSYATSGHKVTMHAQAVSQSGNSTAHPNMQPYIGLHYCIALQGIYPTRN